MQKSSEFQILAIDTVLESTTNPRQTFKPTKLEELAESIRQHGLIQPITVRPNHDQLEVCLLSQQSDVATPIRSITERHSLSPASFTRCLNSVPCGRACPAKGRDIGLTLFSLNDTSNVVPACTPAA